MLQRATYNKFKGFLVENGIQQKEVAELLNISVPTFNKRLNGTGSDFSIQDVKKICSRYNIKAEIFFN